MTAQYLLQDTGRVTDDGRKEKLLEKYGSNIMLRDGPRLMSCVHQGCDVEQCALRKEILQLQVLRAGPENAGDIFNFVHFDLLQGTTSGPPWNTPWPG